MEKTNEIKKHIAINIKPDSILFFDMDGTLIDTDFANYLSYKKAIQSVTNNKIDVPYNPIERFDRSLLKKLLPNLTETEYEKIIKRKEEYYQGHLSYTKLNKLVVDILVQYSKTNKTILVTNCREDRALMTLNYHGLTDKFDNFFFRKFSNNNQKINKFQNTISALGISAKSVVAFENEETEIADAKQAGIEIINLITI